MVIKTRIKNILVNNSDFVRGLCMYYKYHFLSMHCTVKNLKKKGFSYIKPYKKYNWKDRELFAEYYTAKFGGEKILIKVSDSFGVLEREVKILQYIYANGDVLSEYTPKLVAYDLSSQTPYIATKYIDGRSVEKITSVQNIKKIYEQLAFILNELYKLGVLHMDIRTENILICKDNSIKLIDFGLAYCEQFTKGDVLYEFSILPAVMNNFGGFSHPAPGFYDDAYAILVYLKSIYPEFKKDFKKEWLHLNELIGRHTYTFSKVEK